MQKHLQTFPSSGGIITKVNFYKKCCDGSLFKIAVLKQIRRYGHLNTIFDDLKDENWSY